MLKKKNFVVLIRGISIVFTLILGSSLISQTYLDVGDDPEKIEVVEVKQVTAGGGYRLSTVYNIPNWSPDGKYFVGIKNGGTVLFNENGQKIK